MEKNSPINDLISTTMEQVRATADANTIIGTPIQAEGVTLIPVSRLSFGVAGGGGEFSTKKPTDANHNNFGGGSGASAKLEPVAFLVIQAGNVKLLPVNPFPPTSVDRVIETMPEVVDKITEFIDHQQKKKAEKEAGGAVDYAE